MKKVHFFNHPKNTKMRFFAYPKKSTFQFFGDVQNFKKLIFKRLNFFTVFDPTEQSKYDAKNFLINPKEKAHGEDWFHWTRPHGRTHGK